MLSFSSLAQVDSVAKSGKKPRLSLKRPNRITGKSPFSIYSSKSQLNYSYETDPKLIIQKDAALDLKDAKIASRLGEYFEKRVDDGLQ